MVNELLTEGAAPVPAVEGGSVLDDNDPHWDADPIWYDRAEPEVLPGLLLNGLAYLVLLVLAGMAGVMRLYRLPDALWCSTADQIRRRTTQPRLF
ncbi:hypothetical protein JHFBIEKO_4052 [Methylobacterium mesophilicum]|nr:hypothetical protein JHFBIEKO_4052 [Methylobacterium mesophilicum]